MSLRRESLHLEEKAVEKEPVETAGLGEHVRGRQFSLEPPDVAIVEADQRKLKRELKGRHMQMIAMQVMSINDRINTDCIPVVVRLVRVCSLVAAELFRLEALALY